MNRHERRAGRMLAPAGWGTWEPHVLPPITEEWIARAAAELGQPIAAMREAAGAARDIDGVMCNRVYQVNIKRIPETPGWPAMIYLSIKRRDKQAVGVEHFRDFQRIKNELVGSENEAVELYPAESRLVDCANQYHLWVIAEAGVALPFGFGQRFVSGLSAAGAVQMPFADAVTS